VNIAKGRLQHSKRSYWQPETGRVRFLNATARGVAMTRKDILAWYGCIGLTVAALALIGGIVAAPLLPAVWAPTLTVAQR
jgi:hypothetical protein